MSALRHEARRSLWNQYFTWHALPRSQNRFSFPPDFRRLSGGSAAPKPVADRQVAGRSTGGIAADHPPAHPFHMPGDSPPTGRPRYRGKYRIAVGQFSQHLPGLCPPLIRTASAERSNNFNRAAGNAFRTSSHGAMTFSPCETKAPPAKP